MIYNLSYRAYHPIIDFINEIWSIRKVTKLHRLSTAAQYTIVFLYANLQNCHFYMSHPKTAIMKHIYSDSAHQYETFELLTITLCLTKPEI